MKLVMNIGTACAPEMVRKVEAKGRGIIAQSSQARENLYLIEAMGASFMEPSECHILKDYFGSSKLMPVTVTVVV